MVSILAHISAIMYVVNSLWTSFTKGGLFHDDLHNSLLLLSEYLLVTVLFTLEPIYLTWGLLRLFGKLKKTALADRIAACIFVSWLLFLIRDKTQAFNVEGRVTLNVLRPMLFYYSYLVIIVFLHRKMMAPLCSRWPIISRILRFSPVTSSTRSHEPKYCFVFSNWRGMVEIPSVSGGTPGVSERPIASWENSANDDASSMEVRNATEVIPYKLRSVREDSIDFYQRDPALSDMLVADPDLEYLTNEVERIEREITNDQKNPLSQRAITMEPVANVSRGGEFGMIMAQLQSPLLMDMHSTLCYSSL